MTRAQMEKQRLEAAEDLEYMTQAKVAEKYGVSRTTASRWACVIARDGPDALKAKKCTGRPRMLKPAQLLKVKEWRREGLTTSKLAAAIEEEFGVHYNPDHVGRLLHQQLGFPPFKRKAARTAS